MPFVREPTLATLRALADAASAGQPKTVVVTGPAGIGKSTLLSALVRDLDQSGGFVLTGSCPPIAGLDLPLAAVIQSLRTLVPRLSTEDAAAVLGPARDVIARLAPSLADGTVPSSEPLSAGIVFDHLLGILERLAERKGLVALVLDDLQWGGPSTWDFLAHLATNLVGTPVLVVAALRISDLAPQGHEERVFVELRRRQAVMSIELGPLDDAEVLELLTAWAPGVPVDDRQRITDAASGNPLLLTELARAANTGAPGIPETLRETVLYRIEVEAESTRALLHAAAVIGRSAPADLVIRASGLDEATGTDALRLAVRAGLLRRTDDAVGFAENIVRQILYDELVPAQRARLHGGVARAMSASATPATDVDRLVELAAHWRAARDSARALPALLRAADAAERSYAFREANRLYNEAFAVLDEARPPEERRRIGFQMAASSSEAEWADVRARAAEAASLAGDPDRAIVDVDLALRGRSEPRWRERRARYLMEAGRSEDALVAYGQLVESMPAQDLELPRVLAAHAGALQTAGRYAGADEVARRALALARERGNRTEEWRALVVAGIARAHQGDAEASLEYLTHARRLAAQRPSGTMVRPRVTRIGEILGSQLAASRALGWIGRPADAAAWAADADDAERLGAARWVLEREVVAARQAYRAGSWDECVEACVRVVEADGPTAVEAQMIRARVAVGRGEWEVAAADLGAVEPYLGTDRRIDVVLDYHLAAGEMALWQRRLGEAAELLEAGLRALAESEDRVALAELCLLALRVETEGYEDAALRRGSPELAERAASIARIEAESRALASPTPRGAAIANAASAEARRATKASPAEWRASVESANAIREPYLAAYGRWRLSETLLAAGSSGRGDAAAELRSAHSAAIALRAAPLTMQIERLAARARIELTPSPPPTSSEGVRDPGHVLGLSDREVEVLALVALGRTNRQIADELFITEKTAGHHVSNILGKLDVANRMEAAAVAHRAGLTAPQ